MPWKETCALDERKRFIDEWLSGQWTMTELCRRHGVSRKTGYKTVGRFMEKGAQGLKEKSRAPHHRPAAVDARTLDLVVQLRRERPNWGPRKLIQFMRRNHPELGLPSHATVSRRLRELGLSQRPKRSRAAAGYCSPYSGYYGPNAAWSVDFKGPLKLRRTRRQCHPLTISDVTSRYLLRCNGMARIDGRRTQRAFESAFREYGLPEVIRSDNGAPFASASLGGLSRLSVWWIKLGIRPHRIPPGRPTFNARHERMHRTLNEECIRATTLREQQYVFDRFRTDFNHQRPHDSLNGNVPADIYTPSARRFPRKLRDPVYPDEFFVERLGTRGELRFQGNTHPLSPLLAGELVGLRRCEQRIWEVSFGPVHLGLFQPKGFRAGRRFNP